MATIANINLKDSANANKTYVPERVQTGVYASWVNRDQGTKLGYKRASLQVRATVAAYEKHAGKITLPSIDATTGDVRYINSLAFESKIHEKSSTAEKLELVYSFAALLGLTPIQTALSTGESISG